MTDPVLKLYRTYKHRNLGMSFTMCKYILDDLMDDIEFFGIEASDPAALIYAWNELCAKDRPGSSEISSLEAEILIDEMIHYDQRFQVYFANMQLRMAQAVGE